LIARQLLLGGLSHEERKWLLAVTKKSPNWVIPANAGWWFQTFGLFSIIYGISSFPFDELIFFKIVKSPPTSKSILQLGELKLSSFDSWG